MTLATMTYMLTESTQSASKDSKDRATKKPRELAVRIGVSDPRKLNNTNQG